MAKQITALEMLWRESDRNSRLFTDEERNRKAEQKPVVKHASALEVLVSVIEDKCKGGGIFNCTPRALLLLIYKKSDSVYDAEFHRMLAESHIDECVKVITPHMKNRGIDCWEFGSGVFQNPLLRFQKKGKR